MNRRNLQTVSGLVFFLLGSVSAQATDYTGLSRLNASQKHLVKLCKRSYLQRDSKAEKELETLTQAGLRKRLAPCLKHLKPTNPEYGYTAFVLAFNGIDIRENYNRLRGCCDEEGNDIFPYVSFQIYRRHQKDYIFNELMDTTEDGALAIDWDCARASLFTVYPDAMLQVAAKNPKRLDILAQSLAGECFYGYEAGYKKIKPYLQNTVKGDNAAMANAAQVCLKRIAAQEKFLTDMDAAQKREHEVKSKGVK